MNYNQVCVKANNETELELVIEGCREQHITVSDTKDQRKRMLQNCLKIDLIKREAYPLTDYEYLQWVNNNKCLPFSVEQYLDSYNDIFSNDSYYSGSYIMEFNYNSTPIVD